MGGSLREAAFGRPLFLSGALAREPEARYDVAPDYIGMVCTSASVSLREILTPDELVKALLTGKAPREGALDSRCL
jgi:hypothetical protein